MREVGTRHGSRAARAAARAGRRRSLRAGVLAGVAVLLQALVVPAAHATTPGGSPSGTALAGHGSTKTFMRSGTLSTSGQGMFGPTVGASKTFSIFDVSLDESGDFNAIEEACLFGECGKFGLSASGSIDATISMSVELNGLDKGTLSVDYPVKVTFTAPADNSFNPGDTVDITTSMVVDPANAKIVAKFPKLDSIDLPARMAVDASAKANACFFACTGNGNLFPPFAFDVSGDIVSVPASSLDLGCSGFLTSFPLGLSTNSAASKCGGKAFVFNPNPVVNSSLNPDGTISGSGSDQYVNIPVSLVTWMGRLVGLPLWLQLNPTVSLGGVEVGWTSLNVIFSALETMEQELKFAPRVDLNLDWGKALPFQVIDGVNGAINGQGTGDNATFEVGDTLRLTTNAVNNKVIPVTPTLIMGRATMTNKTTSVTTGTMDLHALGVTFTVPKFEICDPFGLLGCGEIWPATSETHGPAWTETQNLGSGAKNVFNGSFQLGGFADVVLAPFDLVPRPIIEIRKALVPTWGPGTFDILLDGGLVLDDVRDGATTGRMVVEPGTRVITEVGDNLRLYDVSVRCVASDGGATHTSGGNGVGLVLTGGEDLVCTVQNALPIPTECLGMTFDNMIFGTDQADRILGTPGNDLIIGYGGDDQIVSGDGDDCVAGNEGDDRIFLNLGNNVADGGPGYDRIAAGFGTFTNICRAEEVARC